jgi:acyl-CoA reductase-like NAD-dependent aldehyde dehydrogenase
MTTPDFSALVSRHRKYFHTGITRSVEWRESQLTALRTMMNDHADVFYAALWADLRRNRTDADWTDVKYITSELDLFAGDSGVKEHILNLTTSGDAVMSDHQPSLSVACSAVAAHSPFGVARWPVILSIFMR